MAETEAPAHPIEPKKIADTIRHLCMDKVYCRVMRADDQRNASLAKFLSIETHEDGTHDFQISVPANMMEPQKLEPLRVAFDYDERGMFFTTEFRQRVIYRQRGKSKGIDAWRVTYPNAIYVMQRREFFRVTADLENLVRIALEIPDAEDEDENPDIIGDMDTFEEISGALWDISGGGLSFLLELAPATPFKRGDMINMKMALPHTSGTTSLPGRIVYIKERPDGEKLYCVQFTNITTNLDNKHSINNVMHYVAEREREILASKPKHDNDKA